MSFREKPDLATAEAYIKSGDYLWNAGMFIWSVSSILDAFTKYAGDILTVLSEKEELFGSNILLPDTFNELKRQLNQTLITQNAKTVIGMNSGFNSKVYW